VGAAAGAAVAHRHRGEDEEALPDQSQYAPLDQSQYAPAPPSAADQIEHLAQLHASGVLTDDEFASAKAKVLG
jgi:hypothetical protein